MKFKDIKAGDLVLVRSEVRIGWGGSQSFWLPKSVDKVTPKQFVVGDKRYKKDDGSCVGYGFEYKAKLIEEEESQLKERNALVKKLNSAYTIKKIVEKIKINHDHKHLSTLLIKLREIERLVGDDK